MQFSLHHLAIHELVKQPESSEADLRLSDRLQLVDERAEQLVGQLHRTFSGKNDVLNGQLAAPEDALFPGYFQVLQEAGFGSEAFLQFSRESMQALQLSLQGVSGAKGGYLVYAFYSAGPTDYQQSSYVGIFLVRNKEGIVLNLTENGHFQLHPTTYLDVDRMALAGKIKIKRGQADWQPTIEVIKHGRTQKDISDYFVNWLALEEAYSSQDITNSFLEAVAATPPPTDEETGLPLDRGDFREQVAQYARKSPGKVINIPEFEAKFYGDAQPLQTYFADNKLPQQEEFRVDGRAIRDYHFHKLKTNGMYLGCKHAFLLSGKVRIEGQLIIVDDEDLLAQLQDLLAFTAT